MGVFASKKIAANDFYETFSYSLVLIHQSIKCNIEHITSLEADKLPTNDDGNEAFFEYCKLSMNFLIAHHVGEDRFMFPFLNKVSGEPELMKQEIGEHLQLESTLAEIASLLVKSDKSSTERAKGIISNFKVISGVLFGEKGHLKREEEVCTVENLRKWTTEVDLRKLNDDLHKVIPEFIDKMDGLIFIIYHLSDEQKMFWDERLPLIVTWFLFPARANKNIKVWTFAPHRRLTSAGKLAWTQK